MPTAEVTAYDWVPDFARGFVRDLRVRWALEEADETYDENLIDHEFKTTPAYRVRQPFSQVPALRQGAIDMFESGAIVIHIAERSEALCPRDEAGRARMVSWVLAALNTLEPWVSQYAEIKLFRAGEAWTKERLPQVEEMLRARLGQLADWLGDKDYLEGRFTAGDLIMVTVLRELADGELLDAFPSLKTYLARGKERPAFRRALDAQLASLRLDAPAASA